MTKEQIEILVAFEVAMQTFADAWQDPKTSNVQLCVAYGGAAALLILVKQTTDIKEVAVKAADLLNAAAEQLGLPATN